MLLSDNGSEYSRTPHAFSNNNNNDARTPWRILIVTRNLVCFRKWNIALKSCTRYSPVAVDVFFNIGKTRARRLRPATGFRDHIGA